MVESFKKSHELDIKLSEITSKSNFNLGAKEFVPQGMSSTKIGVVDDLSILSRYHKKFEPNTNDEQPEADPKTGELKKTCGCQTPYDWIYWSKNQFTNILAFFTPSHAIIKKLLLVSTRT